MQQTGPAWRPGEDSEMKQRQRKHQRQRAPTQPTGCEPRDESTVASLDEGLSETFPASDPVSVSVTRIETPDDQCAPGEGSPTR